MTYTPYVANTLNSACILQTSEKKKKLRFNGNNETNEVKFMK